MTPGLSLAERLARMKAREYKRRHRDKKRGGPPTKVWRYATDEERRAAQRRAKRDYMRRVRGHAA